MSTVVERRVHLAPRPESARRARRLVAAALTQAGRTDLLETAELLVSELVTNSVVHARTGIDLVVTAGAAGLRVAVRDGSAHLPTRRHYGRAATTGRGLELVTLLSHRHGTDTDEVGKTVWFEIGGGAGPAAPAAPGPPAGADTPGRPTTVRLTGVPVALVLAWSQHADTLLREHLLAQWEDPVDSDVIPDGRAHDAFSLLADALGPLTRLPDGSGRADVSLAVTPDVVAGFAALDDLLEAVMSSAELGQMLAPATQPEVRLLRRWICDEVRDQAAGASPTPWPGLPTDVAPSTVPAPDWDVSHVRRAAEAVVAADDLNRIMAASPAALDLLGWDDDLVGRRIVEIVPERLREAHIAGFTQHLLTGSSSILGTVAEVPALRRDGTELPIRLVVRRLQSRDGRAVFTATLERAPEPSSGRPDPS